MTAHGEPQMPIETIKWLLELKRIAWLRIMTHTHIARHGWHRFDELQILHNIPAISGENRIPLIVTIFSTVTITANLKPRISL